MTAALAFKDPRRLLTEWLGMEPKLQEVVWYMLEHTWPTAIPAMVTSIWRSKGENEAAGAKTTIHCTRPHRAIDFSLRGLSGTDIDRVKKMINKQWRYDTTRPKIKVAYVHDAGSGTHLHIQVHEDTHESNV